MRLAQARTRICTLSVLRSRVATMTAAPPRHTNRLAKEESPYLLQHAHNPVEWYPWGEEAFETARREDKPIFLSVGYATCHWCHVMERESFESEEVAVRTCDCWTSSLGTCWKQTALRPRRTRKASRIAVSAPPFVAGPPVCGEVGFASSRGAAFAHTPLGHPQRVVRRCEG